MSCPDGIWTPLVTPFFENGDLDLNGLQRNVASQRRAGVHGLVATPTTGEAPSLDTAERVAVWRVVRDAADGLPLFVGVGSTNERETYALISAAEELGVDGLFLITPYFYKFTRTEMLQYFHRIAGRTQLGLMIYNSTYAGVPLDLDAVAEVSQLRTVVALKEGNQLQFGEDVRVAAGRLKVFTARDLYLFESMALGGKGALAFSANVVPDMNLAIYKACTAGRWAEARTLQQRLNPLIWQFVRRSFPAAIKAAMNLLGAAGGYVRPPLSSLTDVEIAELGDVLRAIAPGVLA
jgi:4-hydroxy-tetrahydrodipicolinate synthase